jgi:hypothetical protein
MNHRTFEENRRLTSTECAFGEKRLTSTECAFGEKTDSVADDEANCLNNWISSNIEPMECSFGSKRGSAATCFADFFPSEDVVPIDSPPVASNSQVLTSAPSSKESTSLRADRRGKPLIQTPNSSDVLFGRGKGTTTNLGNMVLVGIVNMYYERYQATARHLRGKIAEDIRVAMKANGNRFLRRDCLIDEFWEEVNHEVAREKIAHCFRSVRKAKGGKGKLLCFALGIRDFDGHVC